MTNYNSDMLIDLPLLPVLHGAAGPWDEIINLVPFVVGVFLLGYLYFTSRRQRQALDNDPPGAATPSEPDSGGDRNPQ